MGHRIVFRGGQDGRRAQFGRIQRGSECFAVEAGEEGGGGDDRRDQADVASFGEAGVAGGTAGKREEVGEVGERGVAVDESGVSGY